MTYERNLINKIIEYLFDKVAKKEKFYLLGSPTLTKDSCGHS